MSAIDGGLGALFRERLSPLGFFLQRIETGGTGRGIPDTHWICPPGGTCGWLELKLETSLGCVGLRPEQVSWQHRYRRCGGRVDVAVRLRHEGGPRKGAATDELWLLRGDPRDLRRAGLTPGASWVRGRWIGGPEGWRWDSVAALLLGGD